jgi:glycosyltransferase involved in cell wall biosynthesis
MHRGAELPGAIPLDSAQANADAKVRVSVVTPVRNRKVLLRELIESLWQQSLSPDLYEIVIVDDCSSDGTPAMLEALQRQSPCRLVYRAMDQHQGSVRSRNQGVRAAAGGIIAFTDSDCRVTPRWLELGLSAFDADPGLAFVTGPIYNKPDQKVAFFSVGANPLPGQNPIYPLANAFYRRDVFEEVGGFDESVWLGAVNTTPIEYSDIDLAYRVLGRGYRNGYLQDLVVYHEVLRVGPWQWLMWNLRFVQIPELLRRYPALRKTLLWRGPFVSPDHLLFYIAAAGAAAGLAVNAWFAVLAVPYLIRVSVLPGRLLSVRAWLFAPARAVMLTLRQALISVFLIWGSIRARNLIV